LGTAVQDKCTHRMSAYNCILTLHLTFLTRYVHCYICLLLCDVASGHQNASKLQSLHLLRKILVKLRTASTTSNAI